MTDKSVTRTRSQKPNGVAAPSEGVTAAMSESTPTANESAVTTADSTADAIETFVTTVSDALANCGADEDTVTSVETAGEQLAERVRDDHEQRDEVRDKTARELAEVRSRVTAVEETVESPDNAETESSEAVSSDGEGGGETPQDANTDDTETPPSPETALEDTLRLPEPVAEDSLSANQLRARSVARDIGEYSEYNHEFGNYSLTAKRLRIVLKAQSDDNAAHHETVRRVRDFLSRMGESEVSIVEDRGGTKRLVFAESLVSRIEAWVTHGSVRGDTVGAGVKS